MSALCIIVFLMKQYSDGLEAAIILKYFVMVLEIKGLVSQIADRALWFIYKSVQSP